jgi:hypothetical protein
MGNGLVQPRPHESLKGKTPADLAGIRVVGKDKWLTIIRNASLERRPNIVDRE